MIRRLVHLLCACAIVVGVWGACSPPSPPFISILSASAPPRTLSEDGIDVVSENFFNPFRFDEAVQNKTDSARAARTVELVFLFPLFLEPLTTTADLDAFIEVQDSRDEEGELRTISSYLEPEFPFSFDRAFFPQNGEGDCDVGGTDITCDILLLHFKVDSVPVGTTVILQVDGSAVLVHELSNGVPQPDTFVTGGTGAMGFSVGDNTGTALALQDYSLRLPQDSGDFIEGLFEEGFCASCPTTTFSTKLSLPKVEFYFPPRGVITGIFNQPPARISVYSEAGPPNEPSEVVVLDPFTGLQDGAGGSFTQNVDQQFVAPFDVSDALAARFYTLAIGSDELFVQLGNPGRFLLSPATQSATGKSFIQTVGATTDMPSSDIQSFAVAHVRFPTVLEGGPADHEFIGLGDLPPPGETEQFNLPIFVDPENKMPTVNDIEISVRNAAVFTAVRQVIDSDSNCDQLQATCTVDVDPNSFPEGDFIMFVTALHEIQAGQPPLRLGSDRIRLTVDLTVPQLNAADTLVTDSDLTDGILDQICVTSDERLSALEFTIEPPRSTFVVDLSNITPTEANGAFTYCVDDLDLPGGVGDPNDAFVLTVAGVDLAGNAGDAVLIGIGASGICACAAVGPCAECAPSAVVGQVDQFTPNGVAVPVSGASVALLVDPLDQPTSLTLQDVSFLEVTPNTGTYRANGVPMGVFYPIALRGSILQRGEPIVVLPGFEPNASFVMPGALLVEGATSQTAFQARINECQTTADCPAIGEQDAFLLRTCQGGVCSVAVPPDACQDLACDVSAIEWSGLCSPSAEVCDGLDNDCDGRVDDEPEFERFINAIDCVITGFSPTAVVGYAICSEFVPLRRPFAITNQFGTCTCSERCVDGAFQTCTAQTPAAELCDGEDNDCDGLVDEDFQVGEPCDGSDPDTLEEGRIVCAGTTAATCSEPGDLPLNADPLGSPDRRIGFTYTQNFDDDDAILDRFEVRTTPHATAFDITLKDASGETLGTIALDPNQADIEFLKDGYVRYGFSNLGLPQLPGPGFERNIRLLSSVTFPGGIAPFPPVDTYDFASAECRPGICGDRDVPGSAPDHVLDRDLFDLFAIFGFSFHGCKAALSYILPESSVTPSIPPFRGYISTTFERPSITIGMNGSARFMDGPALWGGSRNRNGFEYATGEPDHDIFWNVCPDEDSVFATSYENCSHPPSRIEDDFPPRNQLDRHDGIVHMEALFCHIPSTEFSPGDVFRPAPGDLIFDLGEWIIDRGHKNYTEVHQVEVHAVARGESENQPTRLWSLTATNRRDKALNVIALLKLTDFDEVCEELTADSAPNCADRHYASWQPVATVRTGSPGGPFHTSDRVFHPPHVLAVIKPSSADEEPLALIHMKIDRPGAVGPSRCVLGRGDITEDRCHCAGEDLDITFPTCGGPRFGSPNGLCGGDKEDDCGADEVDRRLFTDLQREIELTWDFQPTSLPLSSWF